MIAKQQIGDGLIPVAKIGKPFSIDGRLKLHLQTDFPEQFKKDSTFKTGLQDLTVAMFDKTNNTVKFKGYDTPEKAAELTNLVLYTTMERTKTDCKLKEGEFFWFDIIGLSVYEGDLLLGVVEQIEQFAKTDYFNIKTDEELIKNGSAKAFLLPYQDRFVKKISLDEGRVYAEFAKDILDAS